MSDYLSLVSDLAASKTQIAALSEQIQTERARVQALSQDNESFAEKVYGLLRVATELTFSFSQLVEGKMPDATALKEVLAEALQKMEQPKNQSIEELQKKHEEELTSLRRSNTVLKGLIKKNTLLTLPGTIPEESEDVHIPAKTMDSMRSAQQSRLKSHRKSRSFGFGDNISFGFPFKQSIQNEKQTPGFSQIKLETNLNSLDRPCKLRDFAKPESPLAFRFGVRRKASDASLRTTGLLQKTLAQECESPITESKMSKLFGLTNISLVNMSRPIRAGKFRRNKAERVDSDRTEPVVEKTEPVVEKPKPVSETIKQEKSEAEISEELDLIEEIQICAATKIDYTSLDPRYIMTTPAPSIQSPHSLGSEFSHNSVYSDNIDFSKNPSLQSLTEYLSNSSGSAFSLPRRQNACRFNGYQKSLLLPQASRTDSDSLGIYKVRSQNGSVPLIGEPLIAANSNSTVHSTDLRSVLSTCRQKGLLRFEKPDTKVFGFRLRSNSNSGLRKLF